MSNLSKPNLSSREQEFVEALAGLMVPQGMPRSLARLYGYLMLCSEPVGLDRMARDLDMAKSSVSVAARLLEEAQLVRRHSQRGSKRVLYGLPSSPVGHMAEHSRSLGRLGELLQTGAGDVATGPAAERMQTMSRFYLAMRDMTDRAIRAWSRDDIEDDPPGDPSRHGHNG